MVLIPIDMERFAAETARAEIMQKKVVWGSALVVAILLLAIFLMGVL